MLYRELPPLYSYLISVAYVTHDPKCFYRMAHQPGKSAFDRFHNCYVWFRTLEIFLQAKGVVPMERKEKDRPPFKGFINIRLSDDDKEHLGETADMNEIRGVIDNAAALLYQGYKISFSYDKTSGSVQATLACWAEGHPDCGFAISSRHPDFDMALVGLLYKHFTLAKECWTDFAPPAPVSTWD